MREVKRSSLKTSGASSNRWRVKWQNCSRRPMGGVGGKLLHRRFPQGSGYDARRPLHRVDALDKETKTRWTRHDQLIPIQTIHFFGNAPTKLFWKRSRSPRKVKIAMNACANCDRW